MKKRNVAVAGLLSLSLLAGMPAVNVLAAEPTASVQPQENTITRGEFFTMLVKAIDLPEATAQDTYKDVPKDSELAKVVTKLKANGVISGYKDGTIHPERPLKEVEALAMISRALGIPNQPLPGVESPLPAFHWARNTAAWLTAAKFDYKWNNVERALTKQEAQALIGQMLSTSDAAKKLLEESQKAQKDVRSFRITGSMSMRMVLKDKALADLSAEEHKVLDSMAKGMSMKVEGAFEMPNKMHMKTNMDIPGMKEIEMGQMSIEQYIIGKDMYMKMPEGIPADEKDKTASGWMKMQNAFPVDMEAMMKQQLSGLPKELEKKVFYRDLGDGQLAFQGRIDKLSDLSSLMGSMQGMEAIMEQADTMLGSIYMQGVMTLDAQTKMLKDMKVQIVIGYKEAKDMPFKQMIMTQDMKYSDYNGNVKIELPEAAKNAKEMTMDPAQAPVEPKTDKK
jgi:hypothetical protein